MACEDDVGSLQLVKFGAHDSDHPGFITCDRRDSSKSRLHRGRLSSLLRAVTGIAVVMALNASQFSVAHGQEPVDYDPFVHDPLGLIAGYELTSYYGTTGVPDVWEIWVCKPADSTIDDTPSDYAARFNKEITPLYTWLSQSSYEIQFEPGGTVSSDIAPSNAARKDCQQKVDLEVTQAITSGETPTEGMLMVINSGNGSAGWCGLASTQNYSLREEIDPDSGTTSAKLSFEGDAEYPGNGRYVVVWAKDCFLLHTTAHELGHGLGFPHSQHWFYDYDNVMDYMSGNGSVSAWEGGVSRIATPAINRYAAGWVNQQSVAVHTRMDESVSYKLSALDGTVDEDTESEGGTKLQMLILPSEEGSGIFDMLGPRVRSGYDSELLVEGVERYRINQHGAECPYPRPLVNPHCLMTSRRTEHTPHKRKDITLQLSSGQLVQVDGSVEHVFDVGDSFRVGRYPVTIESREGHEFTITVGPRIAISDATTTTAIPHETTTTRGTWKMFFNGEWATVMDQNRRTQPYDPFTADPLGLIAAYELSTYYTSGERTDTWAVWVCQPDGSTISHDPAYYKELFDREIIPYYEWLSGGKYNLRFVEGSTVHLDERVRPHYTRRDCIDLIEDTHPKTGVRWRDGSSNGALIMINAPPGDVDWCGVTSWDKDTRIAERTIGNISTGELVGKLVYGYDGTYPSNGRNVLVFAGDCLVVNTVAHELGHGIGFPHTSAIKDLYDNLMDYMSGGTTESAWTGSVARVGTMSTNRYAAGWIDPSDVAVYPGGGETVTYNLRAHEYSAAETAGEEAESDSEKSYEMLVLPSEYGNQGLFNSFGVRTRTGYDSEILREGVERYINDQSRSRCSPSKLSWWRLCMLIERRTYPSPINSKGYILFPEGRNPVTLKGTMRHVFEPGDITLVGTLKVSILARDDNIFTVRVEPRFEASTTTTTTVAPPPPPPSPPGSGPGGSGPGGSGTAAVVTTTTTTLPSGASRFSDVEGGVHAAPIEAIYDLGVTLGCDSLGRRYCPNDPVTRAQMAAFLVRALEALPGVDIPDGEIEEFSDVDDGAWYWSYVRDLVLLGITDGYPDGTYRPDEFVTRAQMASFLSRAFLNDETRDGDSVPFADVSDANVHARAIQDISSAGVTSGCSAEPVRYCPDEPITRAQMASFIARILGLV